jgi:hypothetical protein
VKEDTGQHVRRPENPTQQVKPRNQSADFILKPTVPLTDGDESKDSMFIYLMEELMKSRDVLTRETDGQQDGRTGLTSRLQSGLEEFLQKRDLDLTPTQRMCDLTPTHRSGVPSSGRSSPHFGHLP